MNASPVTIVSTDSEADVQAALGKPVETKTETAKAESSAAEETLAEKQEESETSETQESKEADTTEKSDPPPKKKNGFKKRIDKLNQRISSLTGEIENLKAQKPQGPVEKVEAKVVADSSKPKADDFESHEAYLEALTDYKVDQRERAALSKQKETEVKSHFDKKHKAYGDKAKEFAKAHEDFDDVISEVGEIRLSLTVQEAILDAGPELAYALAKDKAELERINSLSPIEAARAIGKLEAKLLKEDFSKPVETKTSKAPPPIKTIGSKAGHPKTTRDDLPYEEWVKLRRDELKGT